MSEEIRIRFLIDETTIKKRLKWKDIKMLRSILPGQKVDAETLEKMQTLACRFMADEAGNYLPFEQAFSVFDELSQEEAEDAINKFSAAFQETTLPNESGSQSNSISEAASLAPSNSLDGSAP
jgi:hypothetical protein